MATVSDVIQVSGVRCERCVGRLAGTLRQVDGIEAANANLMGQVSLSWDDGLTSRDAIVETLKRGGFPGGRAGLKGNRRALRGVLLRVRPIRVAG